MNAPTGDQIYAAYHFNMYKYDFVKFVDRMTPEYRTKLWNLTQEPRHAIVLGSLCGYMNVSTVSYLSGTAALVSAVIDMIPVHAAADEAFFDVPMMKGRTLQRFVQVTGNRRRLYTITESYDDPSGAGYDESRRLVREFAADYLIHHFEASLPTFGKITHANPVQDKEFLVERYQEILSAVPILNVLPDDCAATADEVFAFMVRVRSLYPDRTDDIAQFVKERDVMDENALVEYLEYEVKALSNGLL